jgi:hypothetical protein
MSLTVRCWLTDSEDRRVEVRVRYSPATDPYFDRSFGNYLPGDPEDVEVLSARAIDAGANVDEVLAREDEIEELARIAADDAAEAAEDARAEAYAERRLED